MEVEKEITGESERSFKKMKGKK